MLTTDVRRSLLGRLGTPSGVNFAHTHRMAQYGESFGGDEHGRCTDQHETLETACVGCCDGGSFPVRCTVDVSWLKFLVDGKSGGKGAPMSCAMVYWGDNFERFQSAFSRHGAVIALNATQRSLSEVGRRPVLLRA